MRESKMSQLPRDDKKTKNNPMNCAVVRPKRMNIEKKRTREKSHRTVEILILSVECGRHSEY